MEFLDYERIIRDNYPDLIESYVKQYGEEYRCHITSVLENLKYCIFVTPANILDYIDTKANEDYMKAILDSYSELGIDVSSIKIVEDGLKFDDGKIMELTSILFPDLENIENFKKRGIFAFDKKYDNLDVDDPIIVERMLLLERMNLKDKNIAKRDYYNSYKYKNNCLFVNKLFDVISKNVAKREQNYDDLSLFAYDLEKKIIEVGKEWERKFLINCKDLLCREDQELLANDKNLDVTKLRDYDLYFDRTLMVDNFYFSDGPIDYLLGIYNGKLLESDISLKEKDEIVEMGLKYLEIRGFDIEKSNIDNWYCNWYQIDGIKEYLPRKEVLERIVKQKNIDFVNYSHAVASLCIINDYKLGNQEAIIATIVEGNGCSCEIDIYKDNIDYDNISFVVCLTPFMAFYNFFDIYIDHEIRHAIEGSCKRRGKKNILKTGCSVAVADDKFKVTKVEFNDINERITHKLSVEATRERWHQGQFIFSDQYALICDYPFSDYDYDFDNLEFIFEPFRKRIIASRITPDVNAIYEVIPKNDLRKIDKLITNHGYKTIRRLQAISRRLLKKEATNNYDSNTLLRRKGTNNG